MYEEQTYDKVLRLEYTNPELFSAVPKLNLPDLDETACFKPKGVTIIWLSIAGYRPLFAAMSDLQKTDTRRCQSLRGIPFCCNWQKSTPKVSILKFQSINLILWAVLWKNWQFWNWSQRTRPSSSKSLWRLPENP